MTIPESLTEFLSNNDIFTADTLLTYWGGFVTTTQLTLTSLVAGLILAIALAVLRSSRSKLISWPIALYCYIFRGTPLLVQLYVIYFGVTYIDGIQESIWWRWFKDPFYPALLAFALNTCAYTTEIIYGAIKETDRKEIEAALAYGMGSWTRMRRIILPNAFRRAIPAYANEVIFLLQCTSIASVITIVDITGAAQNVYSKHYAPFEAFIFAAVIYLCMTVLILYFFKRLESRFLAYLRPQQ